MVIALSQMQMELDIVPVSKWNEHFEYPTVKAIRQWIFRNKDNFNQKVIREIGNKQYIKMSAFKDWIEEINR